MTAASSAGRVRFTAPNTVVQMHLQIYSDSGEMVFDVTSKGNVLDWTVQDRSGVRLSTGDYLCLVTVKSVSGKLSQRIGEVSVQEQQTELRTADVTQLTSGQQQEIGPVEADAAISILKENEPESTTVISHNGEEGQITRANGALSFRIGDFFRGKDAEQMRLTPEGNLGIGITNPVVRLDVDGLIRASQGIIFPDGTIQYSAASKTLGAPSSRWDQTQNPIGVSPQALTGGGRKKGDVHPLTDGVFDVTASGGSYNINAARMGIGTAFPLVRLHVGAGAAPPVTAGATLLVEDGAATSMVMKSTTGAEMFFYQDQNNGVFGTASTHPLGIRTNNQNRIWIDTAGNVGIGTGLPQTKLHLVGNAGVFTPFRGLTIDQTVNSGTNLSGYAMAVTTTTNGTTGTNFLIDSVGYVGIGTVSPTAKLTVGGAGAFNAGSATRFDLFNTTANTGFLQHVTDGGLWQLATTAGTTRMVVDSTGRVGIGTANPILAKLQVNDTSVGTGVYGNSTIATGVFGQASAALFGGVEGDNSASGGIGVIGKANAASSVGVYGRSDNGVGVNGISANGFAMRADGNTYQQRDKGGWVKAMARVDESGNIISCYNALTGSSAANGTPDGCGFHVDHFTSGGYELNFGFRVDDRFFAITLARQIHFNPDVRNVGATYASGNTSNGVKVHTFFTPETVDTADNEFMIIVY